MSFKEKQETKLKLICGKCDKVIADKFWGPLTKFINKKETCFCYDSKPLLSSGQEPKAKIANQTNKEKEPKAVNPRPQKLPGENPLSAQDTDAVANIDDKYEVISLLGRGGMGSVYKVHHRHLNKTYAIKVLDQKLVPNQVQVKRFKQEAQAASRLTHPNLVAVYDYGMGKEGSPFLVMDFLEGQSLFSLIHEEGFLDSARALDIFIQLTEAINHAHEKGVLHRDIKPSNIMLTRKNDLDFVKIVDFGIAKIVDDEPLLTQNLTMTGEVFGSPHYMSPEQCQGLKPDVRSDIYSIGCVMYEALCGHPPFKAENAIQIILKHINEAPQPFSKMPHDFGISSDLERIVLTCLEKDPAKRYQSTLELLDALIGIRDGKPLKKSRQIMRKVNKALIPATAVVGLLAAFIWVFPLMAPYIVPVPQISNPKEGPHVVASNLDSLANYYYLRRDYKRAIPLLEFGINTYTEGGKHQWQPEDAYLADNNSHIGMCYQRLGDAKKAAPYFQKALGIYQRIGPNRATMMGEAVSNYAELLRTVGNPEAAQEMENDFKQHKTIHKIPGLFK